MKAGKGTYYNPFGQSLHYVVTSDLMGARPLDILGSLPTPISVHAFMRPYHFLLALAPLATLIFAACQDDSTTAPPSVVIPDSTEPVVYSKHIDPIFARSCGSAGCHRNGDAGGGLSLDSWQSVMTGSTSYGAEVVPFSPERSHLFRHINIDTTLGPIAFPHMPLSRDPLPRAHVMTIRRWIADGARNDAGDIWLGDPSRPRLFVTNQSEDVIAVIDVGAEQLARYIDVGVRSGGNPESPHNVVLSPDGAFIYVNLIATGIIEKYDARTFERLGSTSVGSSPAQITVSHDGRRLYVSNFDLTLQQRFIVAVDAASMQVTDTIIDVGDAPHGVVLSPDGETLITTNALGDDLSIIDVGTLEVTKRIPASPGNPLPPGTKAKLEPYQGEFTADGRYFWFTCRGAAQVRIMDMQAGMVIDSIPVATRPLIPAFRPDYREYWVPGQSSGSVSIIDPSTRQVVATINGLEKQPHAVAFTSDGRLAFISCENQNGDAHHPTAGTQIVPGKVYVVDVGSRTVRRVIEVGGFAAGMAIGH